MPFKSVADEMHKFGQGQLHSGSSKGPVVTNPKQAIAISLSQAKKKKGSANPTPNARRGPPRNPSSARRAGGPPGMQLAAALPSGATAGGPEMAPGRRPPFGGPTQGRPPYGGGGYGTNLPSRGGFGR